MAPYYFRPLHIQSFFPLGSLQGLVAALVSDEKLALFVAYGKVLDDQNGLVQQRLADG